MADASVDQLKLSAMLKPVAEATDKRSLGHQASCHSSTRGRILAAAPTTQARRRLGRSVAIPASAIRERPCNEGPKAWRLGARARHARSMHRHTRPRMLRRRVCSCSTRAGSPPLRGHGRALPTIEMNATRSNGELSRRAIVPSRSARQACGSSNLSSTDRRSHIRRRTLHRGIARSREGKIRVVPNPRPKATFLGLPTKTLANRPMREWRASSRDRISRTRYTEKLDDNNAGASNDDP